MEASSSARVQEISLAAIRRMKRRGDKVYHLHLRPSAEMEQRIIARMQRLTGPPAEDNSPKSVGGDCPQRIHARYTNAADVPTMLRQNISPTCNSAKRERTLHGHPTGGKPIPTGNLASEKTHRELGGEIRPEEKTTTPEEQPSLPEMASVPKEFWEFADLCEKRGKGSLPKHQPWDHEIPLIPGMQPAFKPIYSLSRTELEALRGYIEKNLERGYIRPSSSPAGYPILFVPKKNGELRLCVDYRQLNDITVKNRYPLPRIDELQDKFQTAKYFTKFDLREGYHLVRIKEGEEWKTAFRTRLGHFEYTVMPFGLTNAPASFQSLVNDTLRPYLDVFCTAYLDDIIIYSDTLEEHREHIRKVLLALREKDLRIAPEKCKWITQKIEFLGFIITPRHISMDEKKLDAIRK